MSATNQTPSFGGYLKDALREQCLKVQEQLFQHEERLKARQKILTNMLETEAGAAPSESYQPATDPRRSERRIGSSEATTESPEDSSSSDSGGENDGDDLGVFRLSGPVPTHGSSDVDSDLASEKDEHSSRRARVRTGSRLQQLKLLGPNSNKTDGASSANEILSNEAPDSESSVFKPNRPPRLSSVSAASGSGGTTPRKNSVLPPPAPLPLYNFQESASNGGITQDKGVMQPKTGTGALMMWPAPSMSFKMPSQPEMFAVPRERLAEELALHDANRIANSSNTLNKVVYDSLDPNSRSGTFPEEQMGRASFPPFYELKDSNDTTLVFESRFESANLRRAVQVYEYEYDLILKTDYNTRGHTQWFYFRVSNTRKGVQYKFNIVNLVKPDSLYNHGMRPLMYSEKAEAEREEGWRRCGKEICYYHNNIKRKGGGYYTITWTTEFEYNNDVVYFAHCYPYTYTDLQQYLKKIDEDPRKKNRVRRRTLCHTLAGNNCDVLTITSFSCDPESLRMRKGIVVSARVHPGETNASYMMKGFLDYLTGSSLDAKILRDNFVFKIVPMLNPDGVINGNYRCSLAGCDLNRQWLDPSKKLHPTIYYTKMMIRRFMEDRDVIMVTDLHGHSRKKNIFMYGCENKIPSIRLREKIFPRILWKNAKVFSFGDCSFKVQKAKESTARVVLWREMNIINSYTMEASFAGASFGPHANEHFTTRHLEEMGHVFCDAILDFCDPDQSKVSTVMRELELLYPDKELSSDDSCGDSDYEGSSGEGEKGPNSKKKRVKRRRDKGERARKKSAESRKRSESASAFVRSTSAAPSSSVRASSAPVSGKEPKKGKRGKKKKDVRAGRDSEKGETKPVRPQSSGGRGMSGGSTPRGMSIPTSRHRPTTANGYASEGSARVFPRLVGALPKSSMSRSQKQR